MSSREIAALVDKRHDNVKRTIETLADRGVIRLPQFEDVKNEQGQTVQEYQLEKRDSFVVTAQLSPEFTARLVDRWQELEAELARLATQESARVQARQAAALQAPKMTDALKEVRAEIGKETQGHHYSNEYDMINRIVLGMTAKKYRYSQNIPTCDAMRDHLSQEQIRLIELAQRLNEDLILDGDSFDDRKSRIAARIEREKKKPSTKLLK